MEHIRKAVELADGSLGAGKQMGGDTYASLLVPRAGSGQDSADNTQVQVRQFPLKSAHLKSQRIISYNNEDLRSRPFDMLRTQVLQSMQAKAWQFLAVTSPTAGCGKTVTAINLALSIARHPETSVLLVDMDLQRPQVANVLGIPCDQGLLSLLKGRTNLSDAVIQACIGDQRFMVLPCESVTSHSFEWMVSRSMNELLKKIKQNYRSSIVIFDLPPILASDDVISILPQMDCVLFVTAIGLSTVPQIKDCNKHLESAPVVRVVINKSSELGAAYYY